MKHVKYLNVEGNIPVRRPKRRDAETKGFVFTPNFYYQINRKKLGKKLTGS